MITPRGDQVLVEELPPEERTATGIWLPPTHEHQLKKGKVVACGKGLWHLGTSVRITPEISVGDIALFESVGVALVEDAGKKYVLVPQNSIRAIYDGQSSSSNPPQLS